MADAGKDFNIVEGLQYQLDASGSYDPDDDKLFYEWFSPSGITLDDRFSACIALAGEDLFLRGEKFLYCINSSAIRN